ncbi:MAG TPA: V-type ATP synthase subunit E [Anaerolineales bacterium]|nr:V-type ATP synthase subunit E [Anaerolineales bacterium]
MSLEAVLGVIDQDCSARVAEIETGIGAEIAAVERAARQEAERVRLEALAAAVRPSQRLRLEAQHRARLEALEVVDAAQVELLETARVRIREILAETRRAPGYPALFAHLARQALAELAGSLEPDEVPFLSADPCDRAVLEALRETLDPAPETEYDRSGWGGVVARSRDGRVLVDNFLETRFERAWPVLRAELARSLVNG